MGVLVKEEPYLHEVGHCDRCGTVLEPLVSEQWWVRMASLAAPGIGAVESGEITFHPARYTDVYLHWMRNIHDWCISRQIWLGHAIPVSTCANGHRFAWIDPPAECPECGDTSLTNDPDVLDTWFSSGLWPFAIFGWPEKTEDLEKFYPTDALVTGRDIIFLWVARMIMTGLKFTGRNPFSNVLITSTIQAVDGSRMSKSKGNTIDPLDLIDQYGADAVRAWAAAVSTSGQDMRFDADRIASYQRFANKLWQVTSGFLVAKVGGGSVADLDVHPPLPETLRPEDRWMLAELAAVVRECDAGFASVPIPRRRGPSLRHHVAFVLRLVRRDHQAAPRGCRRPRVPSRRHLDGGDGDGRTASPAASVHAVCDRGMRAAPSQSRADAPAALVAGGGSALE